MNNKFPPEFHWMEGVRFSQTQAITPASCISSSKRSKVDIVNLRIIFDSVVRVFAILVPEDWKSNNQMAYNIKTYSYAKMDVFQYYSTFYECLVSIYPENFPPLLKANEKREGRYLDRKDLAPLILIPTDFYSLTVADLFGVCKQLDIPTTISSLYPEFGFIPWFFRSNKFSTGEKFKMFSEHIATRFNFEVLEDWYSIESLRQLEGEVSLSNSLFSFVSSCIPEIEWLPWNFRHFISRSFWMKKENQKRFIQTIQKEKGWKSLESLQNLTWDEVFARNGDILKSIFRGSMYNFLSSLYPQHKWLKWELDPIPLAYWEDLSNQREYLTYAISLTTKIRVVQDWYIATFQSIKSAHGYIPFMKSNYSLSKSLLSCFPEMSWEPWLFSQAPSIWYSKENTKKYFEWLFSNLGITSPSQWHIIQNCSLALPKTYMHSLYSILRELYPEKENEMNPWEWRFRPSNNGIEDKMARCFFFSLPISIPMDLTIFSISELFGKGGSFLWQIKTSSSDSFHLLSVLTHVFPEIPFPPSLFPHFHNSHKNKNWLDAARFLSVSKALGIKEKKDWYRVHRDTIKRNGGYALLEKYGTLSALLNEFHPDVKWKEEGKEVTVFFPIN